MKRSVPDPLLEQLRLGELPADAAASLRASLTEADRARLAALDADDAATLARHPSHLVAAAIRRRAAASAPTRAPRRAFLWAVPALAAAAAVTVLTLRPATPPGTGEAPGVGLDDVVRAKGDARLLVYRRTPAGAEPMEAGALARPGDELRLGWLVDAPVSGVLVSFDGRGVTTPHFPLAGSGTTTLPVGRTLLDTAYALDDAPAFERFVLVLGPDVALDRVLAAAESVAHTPDAATRPLPLPAGWRQTDFLVRKAAGAPGDSPAPHAPRPESPRE